MKEYATVILLKNKTSGTIYFFFFKYYSEFLSIYYGILVLKPKC